MALCHRIAYLYLRPDLSDADIAAFEREVRSAASDIPSLVHAHLGQHLPNTVGGGDYTWDLALIDASSCPTWAAQLDASGLTPVFERFIGRTDAVQFRADNVHIVDPDITDFVKRTLFIEVNRNTPPVVAAEFDRVLTGMPRYIPAIRNWAYHRVDDAFTVGPRRWTHVWEQEFNELSGLRVDYMVSPYHWGYVDPWFDPESPTRVVEPGVGHVFCPSQTTILGWFA
jgi:hypothetical protein